MCGRSLCIEVHAVADGFADIDEGEDQHGIRQVFQVEVHDAGVEIDVALMVEEVHGTLHESLVTECDDLCLLLRLLVRGIVEVLQGRRKIVSALCGLLEGKLGAALYE